MDIPAPTIPPTAPERSQSNFFIVIVFLLLILGGAMFYFLSYKIPNGVSPAPSEEPTIGLKLLKAFPKFNSPDVVYPDPHEQDILWIADQGGILKFNLRTDRVVDSYFITEGVISPPTSLARSGDYMIIGFQGGIQKYNLQTRESEILSVEQGLVNGSNILLTNDSTDQNIVWIGTFQGVSKFDVQTEKFSNFQYELGVPGTAWGIRDIRSTPDAFWVIVTANAYSPGGITRYDTKNNTVDVWGPEAFGTKDRVDFSGLDVRGNTAITATDAGFFQYLPSSKTWRLIVRKTQADYQFNSPTIVGQRVYFIQGSTLRYLDLSSRKITTTKFEGQGMFSNQIAYGSLKNQLIIQKVYEITELASNATARNHTVPRPDNFLMTTLLWADDERIIFQNSRGIVSYLPSGQLQQMEGISAPESGRYGVTKVGETYFFYYSPVCEMGGCAPGSIGLSNGVRFDEILSSFDYGQQLFVGENMNQIYLVSETNKVRQFDPGRNSFVSSSHTFDQLQNNPKIKSQTFIDQQSEFITENKDGTYSAKAGAGSAKGDAIQFEIREGNGPWIRREVAVAKAPYNPFGWPATVQISDMKFEVQNQERLWIATDRGLVLYDAKNNTNRLFARDQGLTESAFQTLGFSRGNLIVESQSGVYIYQPPMR